MLNIPLNQVKQKLKNAFIVLLSIYIIVGSLLYFLQEKLLFLPTTLEQSYRFDFVHSFEELFLNTDEGAIINAIHFKVENPKGVILYFHGNAGDLSRWGTVAEYFVGMEYDVLVMDYRTYGKSVGALSEQAFYDDAQFCYNYLKGFYAEHEITLYGRSLGTGIATYLTSKNNPKQLILETPYYSITDVAVSRFPMFPVAKLLKYKFPNFQFIEQVKCPITIFHGTEDEVVPFHSSKKLYETAPKALTTFIEIDGGNHGDLIDFEVYHSQIKKVLR